MSVRILAGDAIDMLRTLEPSSIDACVTDPPAGISFMGRAWDSDKGGRRQWVAWMTEVFTEVYRVMKPGAHGLVWALPRTSHWTAWALEDAGFEVRDKVLHLFGSGFPKGKNQLKPAYEDWWLIRKSLSGTVAQNVLAHGTGALNVDACRLSPSGYTQEAWSQKGASRPTGAAYGQHRPSDTALPAGRWPANVVLSHEPECLEVGTKRVKAAGWRDTDQRTTMLRGNAAPGASNGQHYADADGLETVTAWDCVEACAVRTLDEQSGELHSGARSGHRTQPKTKHAFGNFILQNKQPSLASTGGASRFMYCAKASTAERGPGNDHPTVKSPALMSWLVTLVTPPGGTVLDPFCGSGSTLVAADRLGFDCIGIDSDPHAVEIARRRLEQDAGMFANVEVSA